MVVRAEYTDVKGGGMPVSNHLTDIAAAQKWPPVLFSSYRKNFRAITDGEGATISGRA
jgi:hypothetical protein